MRIGKMRKRLTVKRVTETTDGIGGATEVYAIQGEEGATGKIWAAVNELTGVRALEYAQVIEGKPYEVTTRYRTDITIDSKCTLTYKSRTLYVHSVTTDDLNKIFNIIAYSK